MNQSRIIAAVDIGSFKIVSLIAQVSTDPTTLENSINIMGAATSPSRGIRKGQIVNIEEAVEATIKAVEAAERMAGYNLDSAFISVGGAHIASQNSTGVVAISDPSGEVSPQDVDRVIEAARAVSLPTSRQIIHVLPREYIVDGETGVKDPIGMAGVRLEVETHLVTASSAALKNLTKTINEVGIDIEKVVFAGLASSYSTLSKTEKELGCVLVDIGGGITSVVAFIDGALVFSGTIPIGAKNITNDLAIGLRVSLESAEKIKIAISKESKVKKKAKRDLLDIAEFGVEETKKVSRRTLVEGIIRPRLNEIFTMVRLDLEKAGISNRIPSGAIITGGGAETVGVVDSARRVLSLPVRKAKPSGVGGLVDDILSPAFATSIGLILYGAYNSSSQGLSSLVKKIKFPTGGIIAKFSGLLKDLLP